MEGKDILKRADHFVKLVSKGGWAFWVLFFVVFALLQLLNPWASMPDYAGWNVFGFPFVYVLQDQGDPGYSYLNMIVLLVDMLIVYVAIRIVLFGYRQVTKYKILK